MLDADGRTREALASLERAVLMQDQLAAADPESTRARGETATNYAMRGRLLAKLGERDASLSSLRRAVDISRALSQGNPENVELPRGCRVGAHRTRRCGGDPEPPSRTSDGRSRRRADRDYVEAIEILGALKEKGEIEGTDVDTLNEVRGKLDALRAGK